MNPIKNLIAKHNHKKCEKQYHRIITNVGYSTSHTYVMYMSTVRGYDELFERLKNEGYYYEITGNNREGIFLTVKKDGLMYGENS